VNVKKERNIMTSPKKGQGVGDLKQWQKTRQNRLFKNPHGGGVIDRSAKREMVPSREPAIKKKECGKRLPG